MKKYCAGFQVTLLFFFILCAPAFAAQESGSDAATKEAVLVVAFGTSVEKARISYANVERQIKSTRPGADVRWAWTARSLLATAPKDGSVLSPQEALARLGTEGVKKVTVLSLHIIPGAEYSGLVKTVEAFQGMPKGIDSLTLCAPLLHDTQSMGEVADLLLQSLPKERDAKDAVLFVGHGTHHPAGVYYPALQYYLTARDARAFVGTVEGDLDVSAVGDSLKKSDIGKVWIAPLMTVA
ncbi:sirohydrochlorin cobaltochelatase, partial [Desulfovibrio sp. OttesenSCG-928-G15]|nr:sirohydrochlorin cobaltochelatase [Desulfovibrio sp. OttesenSCG-928-G15]